VTYLSYFRPDPRYFADFNFREPVLTFLSPDRAIFARIRVFFADFNFREPVLTFWPPDSIFWTIIHVWGHVKTFFEISLEGVVRFLNFSTRKSFPYLLNSYLGNLFSYLRIFIFLSQNIYFPISEYLFSFLRILFPLGNLFSYLRIFIFLSQNIYFPISEYLFSSLRILFPLGNLFSYLRIFIFLSQNIYFPLSEYFSPLGLFNSVQTFLIRKYFSESILSSAR